MDREGHFRQGDAELCDSTEIMVSTFEVPSSKSACFEWRIGVRDY